MTTGTYYFNNQPSPTWSVGEDVSFSIAGDLFNNTGLPLVYSAYQGLNYASLPNWLSFDPNTGTFSGVVPAVVPAKLNFTVLAAPQGLGNALDNFSVTVTGGQNIGPSLANQTPPQVWLPGSQVSFTLPANTFADGQGQTLTYSYQGQIDTSWLSFNASTGTLSGTVPTSAPSQYTLTIGAQDQTGYVSPTPDEFSISTIPNVAVAAIIDPFYGNSAPAKPLTHNQPVALTYSFMTMAPTDPFPSENSGWAPISAAGQTIVKQALAAFSAVANITFTQVTDSTASNIRFEGLRARGAAPIIAALMSNDAMRAGGPDVTLPGGLVITQRARRRLLEKLEAQKLIRELTGRATSRLYGL